MTSTSQSSNQPSTAPQDLNGTTSHPPATNAGQPYYHPQDFNYNAHFRPYQFPPGYHSQSDYPMNNFPYPMNNYPANYGQNLTLNQLLQQNHNSNNPASAQPQQNAPGTFPPKQAFPNYSDPGQNSSFQYPPGSNTKGNYDENQLQNFPQGYPQPPLGPIQRYPYPFPNSPMGQQAGSNQSFASSPNRNAPTPNKNMPTSSGNSISGDLSTTDKNNEEKTDASADSASSSDNKKITDESASGSRTASPQSMPNNNDKSLESNHQRSSSKTSSTVKSESSSASPAPTSSANENTSESGGGRVNSPSVKLPSTSSASSTPTPQEVNTPQQAGIPTIAPPTSSSSTPQVMNNNFNPGNAQQNPRMISNYPSHPPMGFFGYPQNGQMPPGMNIPPGPYPPGFHPPHPNPHQMIPNYPNQGGPMPPHSMVNPPAPMGQHGQPLFGYPGMAGHPNIPINQSNNNYPMGPFMHNNNSMVPRPPMVPMMPNGPSSNQQQPPMNHNSMASQTCFMKLMEMGNEQDRYAWVSHYFKFMDDIGKPVITLPQIVKQTCDVYKLYFAVKERGGILAVVKSKKWKDISNQINININASAGYTLRKNYIKYLIDYECKFDRGGIDPTPLIQEIETLSASKKRKQSPAGSVASQDDKSSVLNQSKNSSFNFPPPSPVGSQSSASSSLHQPPPPPSSGTNNSEGTGTPPRVSSTGPQGMMKQQQQQPPFMSPQSHVRMGRNNNIPPQLPPAASAPSTVVHHAPPGTMVNPSGNAGPPSHHPHPHHQHQQQQQQQLQKPPLNNKYSSSVLNNLMMMNHPHYPNIPNQQSGAGKSSHHLPQQKPNSHQLQHQQLPPGQQQFANHQSLKMSDGNNMLTNMGKEYDHQVDPNIVINNSNSLHQQRLFKNTSNMPQRKPSDFFPTGSIEASTVADSPKKKRLRPKDLPAGSLHATRILNGLRSSLHAELIWSLNIINIMLREDSGSVAQEFLNHFHLPTLVQNLANVWRKSLGLLINRKKFIDDLELPEFLTDSNQTVNQRLKSCDKTSFNPDLGSKIYQKLMENGLSENEFKKYLDKTMARRKKFPEKHSKSGRLVVLENLETYKALRSLRTISGEANRKRKFSKIMEESQFKSKLNLKEYAKSYGSYDRINSICDYVIDMMDDRPKAQPEVGLEIESIEKKWLYENQVTALKDFIRNGGGDTTCHINFPHIGSKFILKNSDDHFNDSEILKENLIKKEGDESDSGVETVEIADCPVLSPPQGQKKSQRSKTPPPVINREVDAKKNLLKHYCPLKAREEIVYIGNISKPLRHIDDEKEQIIQICLAASNAFRNLSFVSPADTFLSTHSSFLFIISQILLLSHRHIDENEDWSSVEGTWDDLDFEDDKNWWWIQDLRENSLVSLINVAGQLKLINYNETIVKGILDSVLHWIVCKSSHALDPLPFHRFISPQRLALEALNRLSVHESNVDLLFNLKENEYFDQNSQIFKLFNVLSANLSLPEDQVVRELSISTMHYLVENSRFSMSTVGSHVNVASQMLVKASPCVISGLLNFIESTEMTTRRVIEQFGVQALQERPDLMGSSLELVRRAGSLIDKLISLEIGRSKITVAQEQRILDLATSRVLDATVAQMLSSAIHRLPCNSLTYSYSSFSVERFTIPKLPSMSEINTLIEIANEKISKMAEEKATNKADVTPTEGNENQTVNNEGFASSSPLSARTEDLPDTLTEVESGNESNSKINSIDKDLPPPQLSEETTPKSVDNGSNENGNNLPSLILA